MNSRVRAAAANCPRSLVLFRHHAECVYGMWQCSTLELQLIAQRTCVHKRRSRPGFTGRKRQGRTTSVRWLRAIAWISQTRCEDFATTITCGCFPPSVSVSCLSLGHFFSPCLALTVVRVPHPSTLMSYEDCRAVMGLGNKKNNFIFFSCFK